LVGGHVKYLLDTQVFLWLDSDPIRLSPKITEIFHDTDNVLALSIVSIWEMQIKIQLGKLSLPAPLKKIVREQVAVNQLHLLNIRRKHIYKLDTLPTVHRDPFDRLLISQAITDEYTILTADKTFSLYPVKVID